MSTVDIELSHAGAMPTAMACLDGKQIASESAATDDAAVRQCMRKVAALAPAGVKIVLPYVGKREEFDMPWWEVAERNTARKKAKRGRPRKIDALDVAIPVGLMNMDVVE